jgi:hypothetical protein
VSFWQTMGSVARHISFTLLPLLRLLRWYLEVETPGLPKIVATMTSLPAGIVSV